MPGTWCHSRVVLLGSANTVWCQVRLAQWPEALMEGVRKIGIYISEKAPRKVYKNAKRL